MDIITADNLQVKPDHTHRRRTGITTEMVMTGNIVLHREEIQGTILTDRLIIDIVMPRQETLTNLPLDHESLTVINFVSFHPHIIQITPLLHLHQRVLAMAILLINLP